MKRDEVIETGRAFGRDSGIIPDVDLRAGQVGPYLHSMLEGLAGRLMEQAPAPTLAERVHRIPERWRRLRTAFGRRP